MKNVILSTVLVLSFTQTALAGSWFCEAECGGVSLILSLAAEALVPVYSGGPVQGEGSTIGSAFSNMKNNCSEILHSGFDDYRPGLRIDLNTNVRAASVCRQY